MALSSTSIVLNGIKNGTITSREGAIQAVIRAGYIDSGVAGSLWDSYCYSHLPTNTYPLTVPIVNHAPTGSVTISGEAQQGNTLTVSNTLADADGLGAISYQWFSWETTGANAYIDVPISVVNQTAYTLTAADVGRYIIVKATYIDSNNNSESVTSGQASSYVTAPPADYAPTGSSTLSFPAINEDNGSYTWKDADYYQGFSDPDGDSLQAINIKVTNATITRDTNGVWLLTPDKNYNGTLKLTYDVIDNKGGSIPGKMSFVINPVNDSPIGQAVGFGSGNEDINYNLTSSGLLNGFSDVDGDLLSVTNLIATHGKITTNSDGTWLLIPDSNFNGTVYLNYNVIDNKGGSIAATLNFVLNPINDLPTGYVYLSGETEQGKTLTVSNSLADVDGLGAISYQWLNGGNVISGATQTTYTLTTSDIGKAISVKASYTDLLGTTESILFFYIIHGIK